MNRFVKKIARTALVQLLKRAFASSAGRRLLRISIPYYYDLAGTLRDSLPRRYDNPYFSFERYKARRDVTANDEVVFVSAWFRTGSTLLWRIFRELPEMTSYYEPFNERRWFDPQSRGEATDDTHFGVSEYWREYSGLAHLARYFHEEWSERGMLMNANACQPDMVAYIDELIRAAKGRAVLQFNRLGFRLQWIRRHYPMARIVHLYRHPRDQWLSFVKSTDNCSIGATFESLGQRDFFYLRRWGLDLASIYPFLEESELEHPYELFYLIWNLSYSHGMEHAHHSISYEDLCNNTAATVGLLFERLNIDSTYVADVVESVNRPTSGKWPGYADDAWFANIESRCEAILDEFFRD